MEQGHLSRDLKEMKDVNLHRVLKKRGSTKTRGAYGRRRPPGRGWGPEDP